MSSLGVVAGRRLGVEFVCGVLAGGPSTNYAANGRAVSVRQIREAESTPQFLETEEVRCDRRTKTTKADPKIPRHPDRVNRASSAEAPNRLWATGLTFMPI